MTAAVSTRAAFQPTELGDLPRDWDVSSLGQIARVYSGGTPSRARPAYWGPPVPWVTTTEVDFTEILSTKEHITEAGLAKSSAKVAPKGTLLIAMYGQGKTRGKTAMLGIEAAMNQACAAVETSDPTLARYLFHYLVANYDRIRGLSNTGNQENLSGEIIKGIMVPIPPKPERTRIAAVLDDAANLVMTLGRLIAKKRNIKRGMMQQLLTGRTRLPGFTSSWRPVLLGDHVSFLRSVALSRAQLDSKSPVRYLHYGDIHTSDEIYLAAAESAMPRATERLVGSASRLQVGDLVFADASEDSDGVGRSVEIASVPVEGVVPGLHTIAARFDKSVLSDGFKAHLQFIPAFRTALLRLAAGTKVLATTRSYLSSITLLLPDVDEQRAIARVLAAVDDDLGVLEERLVKAKAVKEGMTQQLLSGRARIDVVGAAG